MVWSGLVKAMVWSNGSVLVVLALVVGPLL